MNKKILSELITKYLNGEASDEEELMLMQWYELSENETDPLDNLSIRKKALLEKKIFLGITQKINKENHLPKRDWFSPVIWFITTGIAAILTIVCILPTLNSNKINQRKEQLTSDVIIKNNSNKILKHVFPDKSIAWLQPFAEVHYKRIFASDVRNISLKGEAFFEVTHHSNWPFIISSGKLRVRVLGTSFNVKGAENDHMPEVSVMTGKVMVYLSDNNTQAKQNKILLLPKEKAIYESGLKLLTKESEQSDDLKIWNKSTLLFDNEPITNVIKQLDNIFDIDIKIKDDEIKTYKLNADFKNVNLATILEMLQTSLDITYEIDNKNIVLRKNKPANQSN